MKKIILVAVPIILVLGGVWYVLGLKKTEVSQVGPIPTPIAASATRTVSPNTQAVPLPTQEDIIRTFFNLVSEKRTPEAVSMLSQKTIPDESAKQAWGVQLASFKSVQVEKIQRTEGDTFRVDLQVQVSEEAANAPIPYYGFSNGQNTRWVTLVKEDGIGKITGLATGP